MFQLGEHIGAHAREFADERGDAVFLRLEAVGEFVVLALLVFELLLTQIELRRPFVERALPLVQARSEIFQTEQHAFEKFVQLVPLGAPGDRTFGRSGRCLAAHRIRRFAARWWPETLAFPVARDG